MIDFLIGTLAQKAPMSASVDVGGVGYLVAISLQTYDRLPPVGDRVHLLTHMHVREDAIQLFGFLDESERTMFRLLQSVSGIGAKLALTILSGTGVEDLRVNVATGNIGALTAIPGIGKKTAERIIVELRDRISKTTDSGSMSVLTSKQRVSTEAVMALLSLGYSRQIAEKAVSDILKQAELSDSSVSEIVRAALRAVSR